MMRIAYASVLVSNPEEAIDFYTNTLGCKLLANTKLPDETHFIEFETPGGGARIVATTISPDLDDGCTQIGGFTNIVWETDDIEAEWKRLRDKGVIFLQPPMDLPNGQTQAIFEDQDRNVFQMYQIK